MRKYGENKTTRIMMATVPHVTSGLGLRKFQVDGFLLDRVYNINYTYRVLLEKLTGSQLVKKFPAFYGNPRFIYRIRKWPASVPILSQLDPVHTPTSHFLKIQLIINLSSTLGSPKWSLSLRFPTQILYTPLFPPNALHSPPISFWQHYTANIITLWLLCVTGNMLHSHAGARAVSHRLLVAEILFPSRPNPCEICC